MTTDVLIVGGGISGLTCGVALAREGLKVEVLEREPTLGGRARSWVDRTTGDVIDIGPHIFISQYPNFFHLLELLGTVKQVVWQEPGLFLHVVDGRDAFPYRVAKLPTPLQFFPSLFKDTHLSMLDTLSASRVSVLALSATAEQLSALDDENALPFLKRMGVSDRHLERYWAFASISIMNVPLELCSAGALLRLHRRLMGNNDFQVGFAAEGLGPLYVPGSKRFIEERGGQVRTAVGVRRFLVEGEQVVGVELDDGSVQRARRVVAAVPPQALRPLVPAAWLHTGRFEKLVRFLPCPYVSVYLWFDQKLTDLQFWARSYRPNDLNTDFYDLTNINPAWRGRPSLVASNIIYSHRTHGLSDEELVARTVAELAEYLPQAATATLRHSVVNRIPMAIHCPFPGTESARAPAGQLQQNLVLAGDWVDTGLPSSMESAARSGWQAAEAVLAAEGRAQKLALEHREMTGMADAFSRGAQLMPHRLARRMVSSRHIGRG